MTRQQAVWKLISSSLRQSVPVMLLYVLESKGSSPGRKGFFMAVNGNGEITGSIGGGIMEHKFVEMAKEILSQDKQVLTIKQQIHDKSAAKNQSGMICSGEQTILLYKVKPADISSIETLELSLQQNRDGVLTFSPKGLIFEDNVGLLQDVFEINTGEDWLYKEQTGYRNHVYIIGGGHCALALSQMFRMLGFYITLYDDRPELNTFCQNDYVNEKHVVNDYNELGSLINRDQFYAVVMTAGYRTDDLVIRTLLNKDFKYMGVLGSKKKIKKLFSDYADLGIDPQLLKKINTPIGIRIKSQTPEEIAVSIAAEIIKVKNASL